MAETKRVAELARTTKETDIALSLNIDGTGVSSIDTGRSHAGAGRPRLRKDGRDYRAGLPPDTERNLPFFHSGGHFYQSGCR